MSLLGLIAWWACVLGGVANAGLEADSACSEPRAAVSSTPVPFSDLAIGQHIAVRSSPQAEDPNDGQNDLPSNDDLTASFDDDHHHLAAHVWERLIVASMATLLVGDQSALFASDAADGSACG